MYYNFPETKFVKENKPSDQVRHIVSEMKEIQDELNKTPLQMTRVYEEIVDLYHSIETLFRMLNGKVLNETVSKVRHKNQVRAYYSRSDEPEPIPTQVTKPLKPLDRLGIHAKEVLDERDLALRAEIVKNAQIELDDYLMDRISIKSTSPVEVEVEVQDEYESLWSVLRQALEQAQDGKGKERHAQGLPFDKQPIMNIPRLQNSDIGLMYQAIKKLQESQRMEKDPAIRERLGAINYIAASILWLKEKEVE